MLQRIDMAFRKVTKVVLITWSIEILNKGKMLTHSSIHFVDMQLVDSSIIDNYTTLFYINIKTS